MASLEDIISEATASVKAKFNPNNQNSVELENFVSEILLFYKGSVNLSSLCGTKESFKATLHLDIATSEDAEQFIKDYSEYNNETIKVAYSRYS